MAKLLKRRNKNDTSLPRYQDDGGSSCRTPALVLTRLVGFSILVLVGLSLFSQRSEVVMFARQASRITQTIVSDTSGCNNSLSQLEQQQQTVTAKLADPGIYRTFSCSKLLHQLRRNPDMQLLDPNRGVINSRRTTTEPTPFYISLHNQSFDTTRWGIMTFGFYYERKLQEAFQEVLRQSPPGSRVLDVGANVGFFSLLSAAQGSFTIDAFEPNLKNRMRFCESLNLNRWFRTEFNSPNNYIIDDGNDDDEPSSTPIVNLYPYGVGQEEGHFVFAEHSNPGQGAFTNHTANATNPHGIQIVTLDNFARERGWFQQNPPPHIAIFKVDVEGYEPNVMAGAKELLQTHMIKNIFMEVSVRTPQERAEQIPCLENLAGPAGYRLYKIGGWQGPSNQVDWSNDGQLVTKILDAAAKEPPRQMNLWWVPDESRTSLR